MAEHILIIPDTHFPDHDKKLWSATLRLIRETNPDEIIHIGDLLDLPQPSRWTKGTRAEFEGSVYQDTERCIRDFLTPLRDVYDGTIRIHEGNHDERTRVYIEKYAPAMAKTDFFNFEKLLRFDDFEIEKLPDFYDVAPGWLTTHGHRGGIRLNQNAGMTALNAAKRIGKSIVMGHTHRAGIASASTGLGGRVDVLTGMEVGHIMDPKKVTYLKGATGNWQQGLGWLTVEGKHVTPKIIPVSAGKMNVNERIFTI